MCRLKFVVIFGIMGQARTKVGDFPSWNDNCWNIVIRTWRVGARRLETSFDEHSNACILTPKLQPPWAGWKLSPADFLMIPAYSAVWKSACLKQQIKFMLTVFHDLPQTTLWSSLKTWESFGEWPAVVEIKPDFKVNGLKPTQPPAWSF